MLGAFQAILGLVSEQVLVTEQQRGMYTEVKQQHPLGLAVVIRSSVVREAVKLLPLAE